VSGAQAAFTQSAAECRCEWGEPGLGALARADVVIVVDVLSFSTCVDVATGRGAVVLPFAHPDARAQAFASAQRAELAGPRETARYSLSPASFSDAPRGLRCVLPSPNGGALALRAAASGSLVLTGCLRNATATARLAARAGASFNVVAAGERWADGALRPALEDWLGAGAILRSLPGAKSPEAAAAIAAFESAESELHDVLARCGSGRELIARGFHRDVALASHLDVSSHGARLAGGAFVAEEAA
jgi:2-phosphosulfolactate phosphatase